MIYFGGQIPIMALCPDCMKPMSVFSRTVHSSLNVGVASDFAAVICHTEGCISKEFMTTIEKKSGTVIYTDALYVYDYEKEEWKPSFKKLGGE